MQLNRNIAEFQRLREAQSRGAHWRRWGPYLSERQWGTVREDYSAGGDAWSFFPHDHARSRAYRWGEDGIAGISDNHQRLCFALSLWNGKDPILKERLFGLGGNEGTHGEDVKERYFYLDSTPTHSYMSYLYQYPVEEFPYAQLRDKNPYGRRDLPEWEIEQSGVFERGYFDVRVEYAKHDSESICVAITAVNRSKETRPLWVLPTLWFRNTWSWAQDSARPVLAKVQRGGGNAIEAKHPDLGTYWLIFGENAELLFTDNDTNMQRLFGSASPSPYVKDAFHRYVISGEKLAVNPNSMGTKAAAVYSFTLRPGEEQTLHMWLTAKPSEEQIDAKKFRETFEKRKNEADEFYETIGVPNVSPELKSVQRQAFAGLLWNKQFYHYIVNTWLEGDPLGPIPPQERRQGRNASWKHLYSDDILSMPDKWEYPWFAAWDLAFHVIPLSLIDPEFAKRQLMLLTREWYMHPNGQMPAYEWSFGDVNPPLHAWAAWRVYKIEKKLYGTGDKAFLESVFQKLLLNFTWWVNRKDPQGKNVFEGGFLGLDNIGVFDRSAQLPTGGVIEQSDSTSWMAMYSLNMLTIALELARDNKCYEDIASKFFEHFLYIAQAMNQLGDKDEGLWDETDGFYYDVLHLPEGKHLPLKVRSMVGLIPLFAVFVLEDDFIEHLPGFSRRMNWFLQNRPDLVKDIASMEQPGVGKRRLLAIVDPSRLRKILARMLDETEFLSPFGIRSLSKFHEKSPYLFPVNGQDYRVDYEPAESQSGFFGGNSNWRGPVWFPVNYLIIESLQRFHYYLGDDFRVEYPTGSGKQLTLWEVARELSLRLISIFERDDKNRAPWMSASEKVDLLNSHPHLTLFYEYFHADNGAGLGASHQAGWTALVAKLIQQAGSFGKKSDSRR